ncbi:putative zinc finger CCHC domain-containing protein 3-like [Apostichopus japonicus]|uniref:Putative zinc finger CCHC domain-containing protein 3-like n=1 Tax=Stichopus japonicus TaxID=307972 RepID=A0A2G8KBQ1_STIJA|nr:putative zinc finger CCHC domain-containing protein 3-like [Apostichopus japonicus]
MKQLLRERSVQLRLQAEEPSVNVFGVLKELGVLPADHLVAVQALPGQVFDVTFKTVEIRKQFWPSMSASCKFTATSYASNMKIVTVLHVPHELDDNVVRLALGRFGKVLGGRFLRYSEFPVLNGTRQYKMQLAKEIPSSLSLGGRSCWVSSIQRRQHGSAEAHQCYQKRRRRANRLLTRKCRLRRKSRQLPLHSETTTSEGPLKALSDTPDVVMEEEVVSIAMGSWSSEMEEVNIVKQSSLVVETTGENAVVQDDVDQSTSLAKRPAEDAPWQLVSRKKERKLTSKRQDRSSSAERKDTTSEAKGLVNQSQIVQEENGGSHARVRDVVMILFLFGVLEPTWSLLIARWS